MKLDPEKIQEDVRKVGVVLIAGSVAARVLNHAAGTAVAVGVFVIGLLLILLGSVVLDGGNCDE